MKITTRIAVFIFSFVLLSCGNSKKSEEDLEEKTVPVTEEHHLENTAIQELSSSPRHHEWVDLKHGNREFKAFVVYPEREQRTKSVIVIHENRGLDDWARLFADRLAGEGFLVIAPDMISNVREGKPRTSDFENPDAARDAIYDLDPRQVTEDLDAAYNYIKNDASSTGEVAVVGFCWGGSQTFRYATNNQEIISAHVFYGTAPDDPDALSNISAPVYGYYGGDDNRVNASIEKTEEYMNAADNEYDYKIYEGAGHAFMRSGIQPDAEKANSTAHDKAWNRLLELLKE